MTNIENPWHRCISCQTAHPKTDEGKWECPTCHRRYKNTPGGWIFDVSLGEVQTFQMGARSKVEAHKCLAMAIEVGATMVYGINRHGIPIDPKHPSNHKYRAIDFSTAREADYIQWTGPIPMLGFLTSLGKFYVSMNTPTPKQRRYCLVKVWKSWNYYDPNRGVQVRDGVVQ